MFTLLLVYCFLNIAVPADTVFIKVPAGVYQVGAKGHALNPLRTVHVNDYYICATEVTNRQFAAFIAATHYRTDAERLCNALVFEPGLEAFRWKQDSTACWRYPNGISGGGIEDKMNHPVTTISYTDIQAYCKWAHQRLPSFEEWEIAARAGSPTTYFWGDDIEQLGKYANVWSGFDHITADSSDGYIYTAPVGSFQPNAWGLYDIYGNVFEFCEGHLKEEKTVHARGGSWWCSRYTCNYFNSVDIGRVHPHVSFSNQGFRVLLP